MLFGFVTLVLLAVSGFAAPLPSQTGGDQSTAQATNNQMTKNVAIGGAVALAAGAIYMAHKSKKQQAQSAKLLAQSAKQHAQDIGGLKGHIDQLYGLGFKSKSETKDLANRVDGIEGGVVKLEGDMGRLHDDLGVPHSQLEPRL